MAREIAKAYEPGQIEPRWAEYWVAEELFKADPSAPGPVFSIVIPPPNVTGSLHIGHMLEHTEIDILTRWHRMRGYNTLYLPGTDHAGISTQRVVVKQLMDQGIDYQKLGREEFEKQSLGVESGGGGQITAQMKRHWGKLRLVEGEIYAFAGNVARGAQSFRAALQRGIDLSRDAAGELVSGLLDGVERSGSEPRGARRDILWHIRYPVAGTDGICSGGNDAAGNDAGRYGGGGASRG